MARFGRWTWRTWFGVAAASIFGVVVLSAVVIKALDRSFRYRVAMDQKRETAFQAGPYRQVDYLLPYLARLPPLTSIKSDGLRFVANPELDELTYSAALHLARGSDRAVGLLTIDREPFGRAATRISYRCSLPADSYVSLRQRLSVRLADFDGNSGMDTDGTSIAIERVFDGKIMSGGGNFIEPYRGIGEIVLARLREGCRGAPLPEIGEDWYGCGNSDPPRCSIAGPTRPAPPFVRGSAP